MIQNVINKVVSLLTAYSIAPEEFTTELLRYYELVEENRKRHEEEQLELKKIQEEKIKDAAKIQQKIEADYNIFHNFFGFESQEDFSAWKEKSPAEYESYLPALNRFLGVEEGEIKSVYNENGSLVVVNDLTIADIRAELENLEVDLTGQSRATKAELYNILVSTVTALNNPITGENQDNTNI